MMPRTPGGGSATDLLLERADRVLGELDLIPAGTETARLSRVVALGGMAVVYRGTTPSGQLVAAKIPVDFVSHWYELHREDLSETLEGAARVLREESAWLDRMAEADLFPPKLFPPEGVDVWFHVGDRFLPVVVLGWCSGIRLRRALGMVAAAGTLARVGTGGARSRRSLVVARWLRGVLAGLRSILREHGGVYTDVAPDNFLVDAGGEPVVFLDAGAIVPVEWDGGVQLRPNYVPSFFQGRLRSVIAGDGPELERLLMGMVAKVFAAGLAGEIPRPDTDPAVGWIEARLPLDTCLFRVLEECLSPAGTAGFDEVLGRLGGCLAELERRGGGSSAPSIWRIQGGGWLPGARVRTGKE